VLKTNSQKLKYSFLLISSLLIVCLSFYFRNEIAHLGSLGLIGIFIVNIIGSATLFLPAPGIATVVAGGFVYNPFLVAIIASIGSAIGDMIGYVLGNSGKEVLIKKDSFWYDVFKEVFHKFGAIFIILFSFIPNPLFDAVGIFAGVFKYPIYKFFIYTLIGRFMRNLLLAYLGASF
jgi:membrane protein YqaA with SNARE-associated domain